MSNTAQSASALLVFQDTEFHPVDRNDQTVWLTANEVRQAIGYADSKSINRLYERNKDEFTPAMTLVVNLTTKGFGNGSSEKDTRIFSLRGAHLLAMLARTEKAKAFRRWVLDILDRETTAAIPVAATGGPTHPDRLELAFALSSEVAAKASRTVFNAIMNGDEDWKHTRWLFCLNYDRNKLEIPWAKQIEPEAIIASMEKLADMILEPGGLCPSNKALAKLAAACNTRLSQRMVV